MLHVKVKVPSVPANEALIVGRMAEVGLASRAAFELMVDELRREGEGAAALASRQAVTTRFREMLGWNEREWLAWAAEHGLARG